MKVCVVILVLFLMTSEQALVKASSSESSSSSSESSSSSSESSSSSSESSASSSESSSSSSSSLESNSESSSECKSVVDNKVTEAEFRSKIATGYWLGIYCVNIGTTGTGGKYNIRWRQSSSGITTRVISDLGSDNTCGNRSFEYLATETDGEVKLNQVGGDRFERFNSQDPAKYFWWLICVEPSTNGDDCIRGFLDLQIRDTRAVKNEGEINLAGIPWDKIAADLKDLRKMSFCDINGPRYIWLGEECPLPAE